MDPSNTWSSLNSLAAKYGEIFQITVLGKTIVFAAGAALAEELCDERRFRKFAGGPIAEIRYAVHDALFTARDGEPSWGVAHRICAPQLSAEAATPWAGEVADLARRWCAATTSRAGPTPAVVLMREMNRLCLEATTLTLFGRRLGCVDAEADHPMLAAMEDATSEAMRRPTRPALVNWLLYGAKWRGAARTMRVGYAEELVAHRRREEADAGGKVDARADLLAALMHGADPDTGARLSESQVIDEVVSMPIGSSTAPCAIASAIYFLCRDRACFDEARREVDEVLRGGDEVTPEQLPRFKYLEGVVREALRLSAAAPGFNVEPIPRSGAVDKSPVLLAGGKYAVAHDQAVIVVLAGVNRDPTVFKDPEVFRPERMMGADFEALPAGVKKWFGNGKRACIGLHWAWMFMVTVLAVLVRKCDFEVVGEGDGGEWKWKQDGWFNLRPVGLRVRVTKRAA